MNRKAIYAEAKRRTANRYGVFTPEALRAHLMRSIGMVKYAAPVIDTSAARITHTAGNWSSTTADVAGAIRRLREKMRNSPPPQFMPVAVSVHAAAMWWGNLSRYFPGERMPLRIHLGNDEHWQGALTARTA